MEHDVKSVASHFDPVGWRSTFERVSSLWLCLVRESMEQRRKYIQWKMISLCLNI